MQRGEAAQELNRAGHSSATHAHRSPTSLTEGEKNTVAPCSDWQVYQLSAPLSELS